MTREHAGRFGRYGECRGCDEERRRGALSPICGACESEAEARAEARYDYSGRR